MTMFTRDGLIDMLRHNIVTVTFTKLNGDERVMKCTLLPEHVPNAPTTNGDLVLESKGSSNNIPVWDLDASGWRSFKVESVKTISIG